MSKEMMEKVLKGDRPPKSVFEPDVLRVEGYHDFLRNHPNYERDTLRKAHAEPQADRDRHLRGEYTGLEKVKHATQRHTRMVERAQKNPQLKYAMRDRRFRPF